MQSTDYESLWNDFSVLVKLVRRLFASRDAWEMFGRCSRERKFGCSSSPRKLAVAKAVHQARNCRIFLWISLNFLNRLKSCPRTSRQVERGNSDSRILKFNFINLRFRWLFTKGLGRTKTLYQVSEQRLQRLQNDPNQSSHIKISKLKSPKIPSKALQSEIFRSPEVHNELPARKVFTNNRLNHSVWINSSSFLCLFFLIIKEPLGNARNSNASFTYANVICHYNLVKKSARGTSPAGLPEDCMSALNLRLTVTNSHLSLRRN